MVFVKRSGCFELGCFVEGAVAEHGEEDVAAASGERDEGLVVAFAFGTFPVVVGAGVGSFSAAKAERNRARLRTLLPFFDGWSPRIEVPDRRVTGAIPA